MQKREQIINVWLDELTESECTHVNAIQIKK